MKATLAIFILGVIAASIAMPNFDLKEDEEVALAMIECVRKTLLNGLPEADIPGHDPFVVTRDLSFEVDLGLATGYLKLDNVLIEHIVNWNVTDIKGVHSSNPERSDYTYSIYWTDMPIVGDWIVGVKTFLGKQEMAGTFSITLKETVFSGIWNMTLPVEGQEEHLDAFSVNIASDVEVDIEAPVPLPLVNEIASSTLTRVINNLDYSKISAALNKRFNDVWLNNATRIDTMINFCKQ